MDHKQGDGLAGECSKEIHGKLLRLHLQNLFCVVPNDPNTEGHARNKSVSLPHTQDVEVRELIRRFPEFFLELITNSVKQLMEKIYFDVYSLGSQKGSST